MWFKIFLSVAALSLLSAGVQADQRGDKPTFDARKFMNDCSATANGDRCRSEQERWLENVARALDGDGNAQIEVADCLYDSCDGAIQINLEESCAWALVRFRRVVFVENATGESPFSILKGACAALYATNTPHDSVETRSKRYYFDTYKVLHRGIDIVF